MKDNNNINENPNVMRFKRITDEMLQTYIRKNHDYGNSFGQSFAEHGAIAGIVRIGDKYNRVKQLLVKKEHQQVSDESAVDTLLDMANYAIMLAMEIQNNQSAISDKKNSTNLLSL